MLRLGLKFSVSDRTYHRDVVATPLYFKNSNAALPPFIIRDARDLLNIDLQFATVFNTSMAAIGVLF